MSAITWNNGRSHCANSTSWKLVEDFPEPPLAISLDKLEACRKLSAGGSLNEEKGLHRFGRDSARRARLILLFLARLRRPADERHAGRAALRVVGAGEGAA